jgi:hypothetical protein
MLGQCFSLGPLDLLELVDFAAFAVVAATDALGERLLKVRVGHEMRKRVKKRFEA